MIIKNFSFIKAILGREFSIYTINYMKLMLLCVTAEDSAQGSSHDDGEDSLSQSSFQSAFGGEMLSSTSPASSIVSLRRYVKK